MWWDQKIGTGGAVECFIELPVLQQIISKKQSKCVKIIKEIYQLTLSAISVLALRLTRKATIVSSSLDTAIWRGVWPSLCNTIVWFSLFRIFLTLGPYSSWFSEDIILQRNQYRRLVSFRSGYFYLYVLADFLYVRYLFFNICPIPALLHKRSLD